MDDIMRDASAEAGVQPASDRSRTLLGADGSRVDVVADAGTDGDDGPRNARELAAMLLSRGTNDMTSLQGGDGEPDADPRQPEAPKDRLLPELPIEPEVPIEPELPIEPEVVPIPTEGISAEAAAAAVAAEEDQLELDESLAVEGEDGLPPVPALADAEAVARMMFVLLLSQRDGLSVFRIAQACNVTQKLVEAALCPLQQWLDQAQLPVEVARAGESVKLLSRPDVFPFLQRLRGVKRMEKLSPAALETLAVIAYRQPVMRGEIEAIRGVKAGPMLRTLLQHKLVRVTGRADVPGRPLQYGTTEQFLERFGLSSLQELPSVKEWKQIS